MLPKMKTVPIDVRRMLALREKITREGTPPEIAALDRQIENLTQQAEAIAEREGLDAAQLLIEQIVALKMEKDSTYTRLMLAMP